MGLWGVLHGHFVRVAGYGRLSKLWNAWAVTSLVRSFLDGSCIRLETFNLKFICVLMNLICVYCWCCTRFLMLSLNLSCLDWASEKMNIKIQTGLRTISVLIQLMKLCQYQDLHASWSFWPYKCLYNFASIQRECLKPWSWSTSPARRQPGSQSARWWPIWGPWTSFWCRFPPNRRPRRLQRKYNCQRKFFLVASTWKCSAPAQPPATLWWWWAHAPSWGIGRRTEASPCARRRSSIRNG